MRVKARRCGMGPRGDVAGAGRSGPDDSQSPDPRPGVPVIVRDGGGRRKGGRGGAREKGPGPYLSAFASAYGLDQTSSSVRDDQPTDVCQKQSPVTVIVPETFRSTRAVRFTVP